MPDLRLSRKTRNMDVVVGTSAASSTSLHCGDMAAGLVHVVGVTASATLTVLGSSDGLTFAPLFDSSGAAVTLTIPAEGGAVVMPEAVFGLRYVTLAADADLGTTTAVVVTFKS